MQVKPLHFTDIGKLLKLFQLQINNNNNNNNKQNPDSVYS